eukprot:TRINITY_DN8476_c0_g1_i2.p1 TRINITY_DN8476_c0_g1~~TRINITY_DN8476_c0_g1_i2.p1  ORF type:complete len:136 (+),score=11.12 TRINITY_DN8476_c0_g1_i2:65-472(+)
MASHSDEIVHEGGCHCKAVRFQVRAPSRYEVVECNCSICTMKGFIHLIVPSTKFNLLQGEDALTTYTFNTGVAKHLFCKFCGISSYYIPRSNPDGFDINVRCLDDYNPDTLAISKFDGQNWEAHASTLEHLSKET